MRLKLPAKHLSKEPIRVETRILVVLGANGSGKSSFGKDLCQRYHGRSQWISGMHALFLPAGQDGDEIDAKKTEWSQLQSIITDRILVPQLSEYEQLMLRLQKEEFEAAVDFKERAKVNPAEQPPVTKIDRIQQIWEKQFPHNRLVRKSGFFELASTRTNGNPYTAVRMSDGEKLVFYLIGTVLSAKPDALLVIESPEVLLHESIKNPLWDELEALRPDCTFVYLTHDIDFATSRRDSQSLWIRAYDSEAHQWDYELIESNETLPEGLFMEILGSRQPVLFIEGTDNHSIDNKLYPLIFPNYKVKPLGGCQKVIETTKALASLQDFHTLDIKGIVDRDRRTEAEITFLRRRHIYVPDVAEVENLLMLEDVIRTVALRLLQDPNEIFRQVKANVVSLFKRDLDSQILLHVRHRVQRKLETALNTKINSINELSEKVDSIQETVNLEETYHNIQREFETYAKQANYESILQVYNYKGMLPQSQLCKLCGINSKETYLNLILTILREGHEGAEIIRHTIRKALGAELSETDKTD